MPGPRAPASAAAAAHWASAIAAAFSTTMRLASRVANAPPAASRIIRNAMTHCASTQRRAKSNACAQGFIIGSTRSGSAARPPHVTCRHGVSRVKTNVASDLPRTDSQVCRSPLSDLFFDLGLASSVTLPTFSFDCPLRPHAYPAVAEGGPDPCSGEWGTGNRDRDRVTTLSQ